MRTRTAQGVGALPATFLFIMANATAAVWWSDSSLSVSGLGTPRTRKPVSARPAFARSAELPIEPLTQLSPSSRMEPTVSDRVKPTVQYRRGAEAPAKSSLSLFVLIGLVVGLFAFGMMSFCLEDPAALMAAREAHRAAAAAQPAQPPVMMVAPALAEPVAAPDPVTTITTADVRLVSKAPHARRRIQPKKSAAKAATAQLPTNPYANLSSM